MEKYKDIMEQYKNIAQNIKMLLTMRNISVPQLSKKTRMNCKTLYNRLHAPWDFRVMELIRIANTLRVPVIRLIDPNEEKKPQIVLDEKTLGNLLKMMNDDCGR